MTKHSNVLSMPPNGSPKLTIAEGASLSTTEPSDAPISELTRSLDSHLHLLPHVPAQRDLQELITTPIFTTSVSNHADLHEASDQSQGAFPQYGLLAGLTDIVDDTPNAGEVPQDPRVFFNVAAPSSIFICGSQGSGKSHTLSCLLENCLAPSSVGKLPKPLTGLVFHYDTFISDYGGSPCEAAFLCSNPEIRVRVLCAPTNLQTIKVWPSLMYRQKLTKDEAYISSLKCRCRAALGR